MTIYTVILILFFLEITALNKIRLFGVRPELLLIATIFFGFHFGMMRGMEVGLISGVLKDVFSIALFGVNALLFLFIGFLSGFLKKSLFKENFITQFLFSLISVYVISAVYFLCLDKTVAGEGISLTHVWAGALFSGGGTMRGGVHAASFAEQFWRACWYKGLYTGCVAPFLFFLLAKVLEINDDTHE
ncbi:MAG: rod shape-determining protein MreD [Omnitrophica bacterium RBG_13_46_9]|nr:MAG: rod shape-determining protein MreD [Omnitrophica bacterium RBG_13_46_9]